MDVLTFTLSGRNGFFKKPDVNAHVYFTYNNIHKVALLGIMGAILGYDGYNNQKESAYPEFYEKLSDLKIAIIPSKKNPNGLIPKKIQAFTNTTGYASYEAGGVLIVKEQWLEDPEWKICVELDSEESKLLAEYLLSNKSVYTPYLGKNNFLADIKKVQIEKAWPVTEVPVIVDSLIDKKNIKKIVNPIEENMFVSVETLPIGLEKITNLYLYQTFIYTNQKLEVNDTSNLFLLESNDVAYFF